MSEEKPVPGSRSVETIEKACVRRPLLFSPRPRSSFARFCDRPHWPRAWIQATDMGHLDTKLKLLLTVIPPQANQQPLVYSRRKDVKTKRRSYKDDNQNSNKIFESGWLSAGPVLVLIAQFTLVPGAIGPHASFARAVEKTLHLNGFAL